MRPVQACSSPYEWPKRMRPDMPQSVGGLGGKDEERWPGLSGMETTPLTPTTLTRGPLYELVWTTLMSRLRPPPVGAGRRSARDDPPGRVRAAQFPRGGPNASLRAAGRGRGGPAHASQDRLRGRSPAPDGELRVNARRRAPR
jgi:hypothetical protein